MTLRDTDRDWETVATRDPYWGVLSAEKFRGEILSDEMRKDFFRTGEQLISTITKEIVRHINSKFSFGRSLDFGCGVGKLLIPIARLSVEAVGVDVSPKMLEIAGRNLSAAGVTNATVLQGDDELSVLDGQFSFVNSYIVLQHIPPERGYSLIERMLGMLSAGGVFSLQLTYAKDRKYLVHEGWRARYYRRDGNMLYDLLANGKSPPEGTITMFDYDLNQIMALLSRTSSSQVVARYTNDNGHLGVHLIGQRQGE